jgi:Uma2 family endonuclease
MPTSPEVRPRKLTRYDYYDLPESGPRYQLIDGDLFMAPAPDRAHQHYSGNLEYLLRRYLESNPAGLIYHAPFDVELNELNVYQPDIVFVRKERSALFTEHGIVGGPDLVIEVLSPKTARFDLGMKRVNYFRSDVEELWIIDPKLKQVAVYKRTDPDNPLLNAKTGDKLTTELLPGFVLSVDAIFAGYEQLD